MNRESSFTGQTTETNRLPEISNEELSNLIFNSEYTTT